MQHITTLCHALQHTIERLEQPEPLQRSLDLLRQAARLGIDGFLAAMEPEHVDLPEADRRRILGNYFSLTCL